MAQFVVSVPDIRVGMVIVEPNKTRTVVKTIDRCNSRRDHIHVNGRDCYDGSAPVTIFEESKSVLDSLFGASIEDAVDALIASDSRS